uniref:Uncharacterized protein n=1 Tax=Anguilla anguilla TaxID=7936 RepID=A0A0E9VZ65_ANGAN
MVQREVGLMTSSSSIVSVSLKLSFLSPDFPPQARHMVLLRTLRTLLKG